MTSTSANSAKRIRFPEPWSDDGKAIWREVNEAYDLSKAELAGLKELCRVVTRLDWLNAELEGAPAVVEGRQGPMSNPLLVEARLTAALAAKLLASLRLPDELSTPAVEDVPDRDPNRPQRRGGARKFYGTNRTHLQLVGE